MSGFEHPMSALVARRVAEAAKGFRNGKLVYVVSDLQNLGDIEVFVGEEGRAAAEQARQRREESGAGKRVGVIGPFRTEPDDTPGAGGGGPEVLDVTVRVKLPDGTTRTEVFEGKEADALFWSRSAVDKFVIPYYAGALGLPYATEVSARFSQENVYMLAHLPDTTIVAVEAR